MHICLYWGPPFLGPNGVYTVQNSKKRGEGGSGTRVFPLFPFFLNLALYRAHFDLKWGSPFWANVQNRTSDFTFASNPEKRIFLIIDVFGGWTMDIGEPTPESSTPKFRMTAFGQLGGQNLENMCRCEIRPKSGSKYRRDGPVQRSNGGPVFRPISAERRVTWSRNVPKYMYNIRFPKCATFFVATVGLK